MEIDGVLVGITPYEKEIPGGYLKRTKTTVGSRLEHPLAVRISMTGYATREILLTDGPMNWISIKGHSHGEYWLLKASHFHAELQALSQVFTGGIAEGLRVSGAGPEAELPLEDLVQRTKPAVLYLRSSSKAGTGFFVTATGVIATNAHLARGETSLFATLPDGTQLEASIVYIDEKLDIAFVKVAGKNLPHLVLGTAPVRQGENVVAIGNPGDAMLFSVTKGIVSAVGPFPAAGPGTWIQTDAPINPGNSGGPLMNSRGEVIGINSQKLIKKNVSGIGFALSVGDLLEVLHRFYPGENLTSASDSDKPDPHDHEAALSFTNASTTSRLPTPESFGTAAVTSEPNGAEIFLDGKFVGNTPATLSLPAGAHRLVLKSLHREDWQRSLEILRDSAVSIKGILGPLDR